MHAKSLESKARRLARKLGCRLVKSRQQQHLNNHGEYQVIDSRNCVVAGADFDCMLSEIIEFLPAWMQ